MSATDSPHLTETTSTPEARITRRPYGVAIPLSIATVLITALLARFLEPAVYLYAGAALVLILIVAYVSSRMREVSSGAEAKQAEAWSLATELGARSEQLQALALELEQVREQLIAARSETERERERFDLVAESNRVLATATDAERALHKIAEVASRSFADICAVDVITGPGTSRTAAIALRGDEGAAIVAKLQSSQLLKRSITRTVAAKEAVLVADFALPPDPREAGGAAEASRSLIVAPLIARGRALGALTVIRAPTQPPYDVRDVAVATDLAARAALALDASRLLQNARAEMADRTAAERAMRESDVRFQTMADAAPVMIWTSDERGACDFFNRRWLEFTGRPIEREVGDGWADGVHAEDRDQCLTTLSEALLSGQSFTIEFRLRRHDGSYGWIMQSGAPRYTDDGTCAGLVGVGIDVEELLTRSGAGRASG